MKRYIKSATVGIREFLWQVCDETTKQLPTGAELIVGGLDDFGIIGAEYNFDFVDDLTDNVTDTFSSSYDVEGAVDYLINAIQQGVDAGDVVFQKDYAKFLESYRSYFDKINKIVSEVAQQNDSDMAYDLDTIIVYPKLACKLVSDLINYKSINFDKRFLTVTHALGMTAVDSEPIGLPRYYLEHAQNQKVDALLCGLNRIEIDVHIDNFIADCNVVRATLQKYFNDLAHAELEPA